MSQGKFLPALCLLERELLRGLSASFVPCVLGGVNDLEHTKALSSHGIDATREEVPTCSAPTHQEEIFEES